MKPCKKVKYSDGDLYLRLRELRDMLQAIEPDSASARRELAIIRDAIAFSLTRLALPGRNDAANDDPPVKPVS
jgi:hypothetical protein